MLVYCYHCTTFNDVITHFFYVRDLQTTSHLYDSNMHKHAQTSLDMFKVLPHVSYVRIIGIFLVKS